MRRVAIRSRAVSAISNAIILLFVIVSASPLNAESLWLNAGAKAQTQYADHRATRAGDILTIVINETTNNTATKETKANKTSTVQDSIASWFLGSQAAKSRNLNLSGTNNYDGKGNITDQEQVTANIAVMVTDVLPNGNLLIEGVRSLSYSNEKQYIVLQGVVRPDDVSGANTVQSTQVANATIDIKDDGDLSTAQRKGWLLKLNDFLNPF